MKEQIKKELERIEKQHHVRVLYAVESGSRAWGFASTDSDWDVRYIYVHSLDWYLKIDEQKDSQEEILANDIDLAGWELKKALRLFRKSNPPMLEWLRSPIVYHASGSAVQQLRELTKEYFDPKACLHHYLHMAEGNFRTYLQHDMVRIKKYFYVLRPILACDWIHRTGNVAPMEFQKLVEHEVTDKTVKEIIEKLLVRKIAGEELSVASKIQPLNDFVERKINFYNEYLKTIKPTPQPNTKQLDALFRESLSEAWT